MGKERASARFKLTLSHALYTDTCILREREEKSVVVGDRAREFDGNSMEIQFSILSSRGWNNLRIVEGKFKRKSLRGCVTRSIANSREKRKNEEEIVADEEWKG